MSQSRALLILVFLTLAVYLGSAWSPALLDDADAGHAVVAREILERGDWVTFYMNGIRYLEKAPLLFWLTAISYHVFGLNEVATRLPLVLAVVGLVLVCYAFGRRLGDERAALYSGLVFASSFGVYLFTRILIADVLLAFFIAAALYCFWRSLETPQFSWGFWAGVAGAVLSKGLVGMIFPLGTVGLYVLATRRWSAILRPRHLGGLLLFFALAAPWHLLASLRTENFAWFYFVNEHFLRYLGKRYPVDYDKVPLLLFWGLNLVWLFPWSVFLPLTLSRDGKTEGNPRLLLWIWAGVVLVFFSFSTRQEYYTMPAYPALALLIGEALARAEAGEKVSGSRRWLTRLQAIPAVLGLVAAVTLAALLWGSREVVPSGDISTLLTSNPDYYRLSLGHVFDLKVETFAALRLIAIVTANVLSVGFVLAWWLRARDRHLGASLATAFTAAAFFFCAHAALVKFEPYLSSKSLALAIERVRQPGDLVVLNGEYYEGSSIGFYIQPKVYLLNGRMTGLEFGSRYPDAPPLFIGDCEIQEWWAGDRRVFLFTQGAKRDRLERQLRRERMYLIAASGGKFVFSNQP